VIDEGHEMLSEENKHDGSHSAKGQALFDSFLSNYRWYVTGTPLPRGRASLVGALNFLQIRLASGNVLSEVLNAQTVVYEIPLFKAAKKYLFWRNTKASVADQAK
jgi:hypothetical protein